MLRGVQRCCRAAARQSLAPAAHESVIGAGAAVSSMWIQSSRYASNDAGSDETEAPISPAIEELADRILELNILQVAQLSKTLKRRMGLPESPFVMGMPMGMQMPGAPAATGGDGGQADEPAEEKTDFNVKLDSFPSDIKIKLIKEVRALLPDLGLKEAKALVEKTPAVLKEKVPKEEAAAMQKKLEELGAKVLLE